MEKCNICNQKLIFTINPLTGAEGALYCEKCNIYWLDSHLDGKLVPHYFCKIPQLLTEASIPGISKYKNLRASIDTNEKKHKHIPHFHIYYGDARSVGYKIEDLSPLGEEKNNEILGQGKNVKNFLDQIRKWLPQNSTENGSITNKEYMLNRYNEIVGML